MIRSGQQFGYILMPVIVVITLVAAIALMMNTESALESNTAGSELDAQQARYVAEAGLNHALWLSQQQGCGPYSNLTDEPLGNDKYTTALTTDLGSTTAFTISVDQDGWIRSDQPTINKGTDLKLHTRNEVAGTERPLLRYDLSPIAANAPILSATAWFYVTDAHAAGPIDIHLTSADWAETDATWDSMSTNMDSAVLATIPSQPVNNIWISVNLTSQVQAWVNGQPNYGITLNSPVDGVHGQYNSRESALPPYLEVIVGTPPSSPAVLKAVGTLANGVTRNITRNDATLVQHPASFVQWQHDATQGVDAYIWEKFPTTNYGNDDEIWVSRSTNNTSLSLFKFDVDKLLPGTRIQNATLSLLHESGNNSNVPVSAHRIVNHWDEANVTWEKADTQDWDTQGGDLDDSAISTTLVGPTSGIRYEWNLTSLVQGWADNAYPNYGVALRTLQNGSIGERFYTSDETIETRRPRLTITYACACGEVCVTPQGSGNLLMVVINPTTLVAEDQQAKDLFESWGYTVSVISESANQSSYDAAVAVNDVVFISETVNSGSVGTSLQNAPIGVVSQDGNYNPDLGLATGSALKVGADINVTDTDHYITRVFTTGPLQVYSAGMEQLIVSSAPTAGQKVLADIGGDASLVALEKGDAMEGGGSAAGRRVMLPLGTRYRFDWDRLNANGRIMVQRALAWGANADKVVGTSPLLMVVANPAALTAQETAKKALIESWDYGVNLIDDAASPTEFVDAFAVNNVIYVSGDVSDAALSSKLVKTSLGVVNEQIALHDELLFSTSAGSNAFNNISVIDNAHYITDGFATGWLTIATVNQPLNALQGTLAPGLKNLAEVWISGANYDYGLAVVDTGGALNGGEIAAGRRAQLPWGATGFDVNTLNNNGETIMQRAIEWAAGGGCGSLQPLLLVVGDATTLSSKDAGMKNLMESWCYLVTVIDDGASQASFDAAAAAADVVYVSGTTSGPSLQDKLTGSPTPIVNEINGKLDNFGFSSSTASSVTASAFSATDAAHYISEPFAGNPVTFFTTNLAMPVPGGTLAPDLQTVGETTGAIPALVTLDAGAQRWDGNPAPARRVHLPFTNADPSQLTADGEILMQRAIEWAWGADATGPIAHWKLDDGAGTTAIDSEGGHDGTLTTGGPVWVAGRLGDALQFDGANDYVDLTSDAELDDVFVGGATVMAWINPASWGGIGYGRIFDKSSVAGSTGDGWAVRLNKDNDGLNFGQGFTSGRGWWRFAESLIDLDTNTWQHIALAYDASSTTNDPIVYLDGNPVAVTRVDTPSGAVRSDAAINLRLGSHASSVFNVFDGKIDDALIYDRMLSAVEIADIAAVSGSGLEGTFLDEFNAIAYNGDDGTLSWSNDWQETGESDGPGSGDFVVLNDPWCASGNCLRIREDRASTRRLSREVDMAGAVSATLSLDYRRRHVSSPIGGTITLEISDNGGSSFTPLKVYDMGTQDAVVQSDSFDISGYIASDTQLRFSTSNVLFETALYVDNVLIDTTVGGGGPPGCDDTFRDEFNTVSFGNNDGTLNWEGDWLEVGESDGPNASDVRVRDDNGPYQLWIRDNNNGGEGAEREADLSGASAATLSFDYRRSSLDTASDYVKLEISANGTAGPWTELARFEGAATDSVYQNFSQDITSYISANTRIRLISSPTMGNTDLVIFENVEICITN